MIEAFIAAVFSRLVADDIREALPSYLQKMVAAAVNKLPPKRQERFLEEWTSHLLQTPGTFPKIYAAAKLVRAARNIALQDRKADERESREVRVRWVVSEFSKQFIEELRVHPQYCHLVLAQQEGFIEHLKHTGVKEISFLAAFAVFGKNWNKSLDEEQNNQVRLSMRKAARLILDGANTRQLGKFSIAGTVFESARFMGKLITTMTPKE